MKWFAQESCVLSFYQYLLTACAGSGTQFCFLCAYNSRGGSDEETCSHHTGQDLEWLTSLSPVDCSLGYTTTVWPSPGSLIYCSAHLCVCTMTEYVSHKRTTPNDVMRYSLFVFHVPTGPSSTHSRDLLTLGNLIQFETWEWRTVSGKNVNAFSTADLKSLAEGAEPIEYLYRALIKRAHRVTQFQSFVSLWCLGSNLGPHIC